jgi:hypothetical protein
MTATRCGWPLGWSGNLSVTCGRAVGHAGSHGSWLEGAVEDAIVGSQAEQPPIETELVEARQLNRRYRDALQRIRERPVPWCEDYAMCDHEGCKASHRAFEIATNALDVESTF